MSKRNDAVEAMLDDLRDKADGPAHVTAGEVAEAVGHRGHGPFLTVPALIQATPIGAVPGVPTLLAAIIVLFAGQIAFGRSHLWLPSAIKRRELSSDRLKRGLDKLQPLARWMDRWFGRRLTALAGPVAARIAAIVSVLLCLTVPPLELVPFAGLAPMGAIAVFGIAMMVRDGALMLAGFVASAAAAVAVLPLL